MGKKDNSIQKFDPTILKKNLTDLMSDSGMNQADFGEIAGISGQSRVSDKLNFKKTTCVSVEELANIALYFNVSTDELLGITPTKKKDEDVTLTDIFQRLFEIDNMVGLELVRNLKPISEYIKLPEALGASEPEEVCTIECLIHFNDGVLTQKLLEWYSLRNIEANEDTKGELLNGWKERLIEKGASCRKANDFQPDDDQPPQKP